MGGHQPRHIVERYGSAHHIVLMRAPAGAFAVDIIAMQHYCMAGDVAGLAGGGKHEPVAGMVVGHGFEWVDGFRRGIFRVRVVDVDAPAVGSDDIGDIELRGVGKHIRSGRGSIETCAARIVDRSSCR